MKNLFKSYALAIAIASLPASAFAAATTVLDQVPAPVPSASNATSNSELLTQSQPVSGGTIYTTILRQPGVNGRVQAIANSFVSAGATSPLRYLTLTNFKQQSGIGLSATPSGGNLAINNGMGYLNLLGETTSASAATDTALAEVDLADTYAAGANIPVIVNANYTGSGTVTGGSTTIAVQAEAISPSGIAVGLTTSPASFQITGTATPYTFTITGTSLVPGSRIGLFLTEVVTTSLGAATGQINSVALQN